MKRFHFRLQRLLKLKRQLERQAELRQSQARASLDAVETEVTGLLDRLTESSRAIESRIGQPVPPDCWVARYQYSAQIGRALDSAETAARFAACKLDEANAARTRVAREAEALSHLRQRQWQAHERQATRTEQQYLDGLSLRRWSAAHGAQVRRARPETGAWSADDAAQDFDADAGAGPT